jgi:hypothetical protein
MVAGIKETSELLEAVNHITIFLIRRLKDGADFKDAIAIYKKLAHDEEFKNMIEVAYNNSRVIPAEIKDLDYQEVIQLLSLQFKYIPEIIDAMKNEK